MSIKLIIYEVVKPNPESKQGNVTRVRKYEKVDTFAYSVEEQMVTAFVEVENKPSSDDIFDEVTP